MKERNKWKRIFIGRGTCMGACWWTVSVTNSYDNKKYPGKMSCGGEFGVNKEGRSHWVENRKDMSAIYKLQQELHAFVADMEAAQADVEDNNKALGYA